MGDKMDKIKIGIPRGLFYYYDGYFLEKFLKHLGFEVIISPKTNRNIIDEGMRYANDEMCLSLKIFLGHVAYLKDKCDYILIMRVDNYGTFEQTCTNFLSLYDLINNTFNLKIIDININHNKRETMYLNLKNLGHKFSIPPSKVKEAYNSSLVKNTKYMKNLITVNKNKLYNKKPKILLVGHSYNLYDEFIGKPIIDYLDQNNISVILSDKFDKKSIKNMCYEYCPNLYWHYNKENINALVSSYQKIDGIIFLSSFPCGPDSLVNELVMRKINKPYLNLVIDDLNSLTGIETRLESFIDILEQKV